MYNILTVSEITALLLNRNDALAASGFRVISPRTPEEAPYLAEEQHIDALVIEHSIRPAVRAVVIQAVRRVCPGCPVLFVYFGYVPQEEPLADVSIELNDVGRLVEVLRDRLRRRGGAVA